MTANNVRSMLIVGGGVGGLALAIRAAEEGRDIDIAEIDPSWSALGAGLTINGMSLRAFEELGVLDAVRARAHVHGGRRAFGPSGEVLVNEPFFVPSPGDRRAGGGILRPVLHQILRERALETAVHARLGVTVNAIEQSASGALVTFSNGERVQYDLVVGADGLRSRVRELVFPDAPAPLFSGEGCWRAVFPRSPEVDCPWSFVGTRFKAGLRPVSEDEMYLHLLETAPDNPWRDPSEWPVLLRELMKTFGGFIGELADQLNESSQVNYRPLETVIVPLPWHRGRVVLIGDAVHATTPHAAYGAGLAVEDALILARQIALPGSLDEQLRRFGEMRYARCRAVVEGALAVAHVEMTKGSEEDWLKAASSLRDIILGPEVVA